MTATCSNDHMLIVVTPISVGKFDPSLAHVCFMHV